MIKEQTIYQSLLESAEKYPQNKALVFEDKKLSYLHVINKVNIIASSLKALGYKKDDVITIMLPNIPMAVYLLYAINQIGAIANLIHPLMKYDQLLGIMKKTNSKILFALDTRIDEFVAFKDLCITLYSVSPVDELNLIKKCFYNLMAKPSHKEKNAKTLLNNKPLKEYDSDFKKDSFYLHSGGTTGEAKTIALSSFALNALVMSGLKMLDINLDQALRHGMLSVLPMFHGFGLCMGIHACLSYGAFNVLMPKFHTKKTIHYLKKGYLQTIIGVPVLFEALLRNKDFKGETLKGLDNAFVGGDFVSESLITRFNERMKGNGRARLFPGYGLTETVTVCSVNTHQHYKFDSVGQAIEGVKIRAFNNDVELPLNEAGELYVSGDTLMNGYRFEEKELDPFYIDKDGVKWIRTGDYGKVDKDEYVYFMQRLKRIVKINGINVFPSEIENEISKYSYIFECYLKKVLHESNKEGLNLYIVLDCNYEKKEHDEEIKEMIRNKFGEHALPKKIIYLDKLPKTLIGKVDEKKLN